MNFLSFNVPNKLKRLLHRKNKMFLVMVILQWAQYRGILDISTNVIKMFCIYNIFDRRIDHSVGGFISYGDLD